MLFTPVKPMLARWGDEAFDDEEFLFEPKWDGWRVQLHKQGERIEAYARNGQRVTDNFPELKEAAASIRGKSVILDCEGIVMRQGRPVFDDFTYRLRISQARKIRDAVRTHPATFVAFDLLYAEEPILDKPLLERKGRLAESVQSSSVLLPTMFIEGQGRALFDMMREREMEGIVAKRKAAAYAPGKVSDDWVKVKHRRALDVIVLGYRTEPFELVIGLNFRTVKNKEVGVVATGIPEEERSRFLAAAAPLRTAAEGSTQWLRPEICCRITYGDRTDTHGLKRTEFVRFNSGARPENCVWKS